VRFDITKINYEYAQRYKKIDLKVSQHTSHKIQSYPIEPKSKFCVFIRVHAMFRRKILIFHNQRVHATTLSISAKRKRQREEKENKNDDYFERNIPDI
jgi:hypothetical protein